MSDPMTHRDEAQTVRHAHPEAPHDHDHDHGPHDHDHDHAHGHGHGHDHPHGGLKGFLHHLFVPHSHDAADSFDSELETHEAGIRAVRLSLWVLAVTAVLQVLVVVVSGSVALLADTIHNFSDAMTAVPLWIAFSLTRRPATARFTYGLGRTEDLAGLFVIAMIALSAVVAGYEAIDRLLHPHPPTHLWVVAAAGVIGFLGNEIVAIHRTRVGRQIGSAALIADGAHAQADGLTSLAVVAGVIGVALGLPAADPIIGLLIALAIVGILVRTGKDVIIRLLDGVDPHLTAQVTDELAHTHGVRGVRDVRVRWIGHTLNAEATLDLDPQLTLVEADDVAHHAEHHLLHRVPRLRRATIHAGPGRQGPVNGP